MCVPVRVRVLDNFVLLQVDNYFNFVVLFAIRTVDHYFQTA